MELDAGNDKGREYNVEALHDSVVYARKLESGYLPGLFYLVSWKGYLKEENTCKSASAVQHLKKLIRSFYNNHSNKSIAIFKAIDTAPPMARPTIRPTN